MRASAKNQGTRRTDEMNSVGKNNNAAMIGISPNELACLKTVVSLLRHPDPTIPALVHQALKYLLEAANRPAPSFSMAEIEPVRRAP